MAGLSNDRLKALCEMIKKERNYQLKWSYRSTDSIRHGSDIPSQCSPPVRTSLEYIGTNPDPCRYHLDYVERLRNARRKPEYQKQFELIKSGVEKADAPHLKSAPKKLETSAQQVGWKIHEKDIPGGRITQNDISAPSVRGSLYRDMYSANWSWIG
jgi:hypothetical protein